jgi:alkylated DNA repair dioxygenase AlkB
VDDEPEMAPSSPLSVSARKRLFRLRRIDGSVAFSERLMHGSLLIMAGDTQKNFKHEVPKSI